MTIAINEVVVPIALAIGGWWGVPIAIDGGVVPLVGGGGFPLPLMGVRCPLPFALLGVECPLSLVVGCPVMELIL